MAPLRLVLIEPDMPGNVGTILRLGACLGIGVDVIEPCGFPWAERRMVRAGLDYLPHADVVRHMDFASFRMAQPGRLVLVETDGAAAHTDFTFRPGDLLALGSEGAGAPDYARAAAAESLRIPLRPGFRSLNVAMAAAMVAGEALRQLGGFSDRTD